MARSQPDGRSLAAFALLGLLIAQVASGLMGDPDDFINVGPLAQYVSSDTASLAIDLHETLAPLLLLLVALHVATIAFYKIWKHEDLIKPMITGWKWVKKSEDA